METEGKHCAICGKAFQPRDGRQILCGNPECERIRGNQRNRELARARRVPLPERACLVCGQTYLPRRRTQKTCGSEECQRKWANRTSQLRGKRSRSPRPKPQAGKPCKLCGLPVGKWGCGEYCSQGCKTADEDGSARRELYPGTAGLIRKWHGEGMSPEEIANLLERDLRQVKEVLDDA